MVPLNLLNNADQLGGRDIITAGGHDGAQRRVDRSPADRRMAPQRCLRRSGQGSAPFLADALDGDVQPSVTAPDNSPRPLPANDVPDGRSHRGRPRDQQETRHRTGPPALEPPVGPESPVPTSTPA